MDSRTVLRVHLLDFVDACKSEIGQDEGARFERPTTFTKFVPHRGSGIVDQNPIRNEGVRILHGEVEYRSLCRRWPDLDVLDWFPADVARGEEPQEFQSVWNLFQAPQERRDFRFNFRGDFFVARREQIRNSLENSYRNAGRGAVPAIDGIVHSARSEERRVGKECRSRWSPYH